MPETSLKTLLRKGIRLFLLVALFMAMAGVGAYLALTLIIKGEETVVVPDLVGHDVVYGLEVLSDLGLNTRVGEALYDDHVPKNHIIDQDPDPGSSIKRGRDVRIHISRGPESVIMPNLAGLSLQQSRILLAENGLCEGTLARMNRRGTTAGTVIAQYPPAGATVAHSRCADLLVSHGKSAAAMAMTDLTGQRLDTALHRLQGMGLALDTIENVQRPGLSPDTVVSQSPAAGWRIAAGSGVRLTVNRVAGVGSDRSLDGSAPAALFRFFPGYGFYKKRVRIERDGSPSAFSIFDDFVPPGQEIWLLIPKNDNSSIHVFVDGQPGAPPVEQSPWVGAGQTPFTGYHDTPYRP